MAKIVMALGGNALGDNPIEQLKLVKNTAKSIIEIIKEGNDLIITHGNGPQVGMIFNAFEESSKINNKLSEMPFPECGAMSQGYIGYHLQNAILSELKKQKINKDVVTIITQVEVNPNDEAFLQPTKPIGSFYSKEESVEIALRKGYKMVEDANRGYRRVVPSPKPIKIMESKVIKNLVAAGHLIITVGGGGIPVIQKGNEYLGVDAVIDKDFASAKLAEEVDADILLILTAVDKVSLNYGKPNQINLDLATSSMITKYINEGHFAKGSMLPKIEAALEFVKGKIEKMAIITSLDNANKALKGEAGTKIIL